MSAGSQAEVRGMIATDFGPRIYMYKITSVLECLSL